MKKRIFFGAALLLAGSLSLSALAADYPDKPLLESGQALYSREADDYLNIDAIRDGGRWRLTEPVYADSGSYILQVRTIYGSGSLSAEALEGELSVKVKRLRPENEPLRAKYTYYTVTLTPPEERESDAPKDFSISLSCGEKSILLQGTLQESEILPIFEGLHYRAGSGPLFRFDEELDEEGAQITCAPGLTLFFLGDYGDETCSLKLSTTLPPEVPELLGEGDFTCYRFTERPVFEDRLTVRLQAPEDALIYELRNGRLYRINTDYEEGCHLFQTDVLTAYLYQNA